jgi:phosphoribosylformylglycinamidine cyclo-ligase
MEIYVPAEVAQDIIAISKSFNIEAQIVGRVEASESKKLTITSEYGKFEY